MSYLSLPQINFKGNVYCNPSTGDNNDLADIFDVDTLQFTNPMTVIDGAKVVDPPNQQTFPYGGATSASDCRTWLMGLMDTSGVQGGEGAFGQQAHWNYYGDHATRLDNTFVTSISPRAGGTVPSNDPLLNAQVNLIGTPSPMQFQDPVIVDNDPYALITSQVFSYGITVTGKDANGNAVTLISANPASRSYAYYINVQKNLDPSAIGFQMVSAIFLLSIPKSPSLVINTSVDSPALKDLAAAVEQGAGLQMRFIFYNAIYAIAPEDLYAQFAAGKYTPNPYLGLNVGSIGVLAPGDMLSAPPGRKLNVQTPLAYALTAPCATSSSGPNSGKVSLGITQVDLDLGTATANLDCISTFPECNVSTNTKYDFGEMTLDLLPASGGRITLGSIPYDQATYETHAGMVSIPLSTHPQWGAIKAEAATGTLVIHSATQNIDALSESAGIDIQTEDRAMYFDVQTLSDWSNPNEQPVPGTTQITIQAFRKGAPIQDSVVVNLEYWMCAKDMINPSKPQVPVPSRYFSIAGAVQQPDTVYQNPPGLKGPVSVITDQVTIPANSNGELTLTLSGIRPGTSLIRYVDPTIPQVTPNFCWENTSYSCIRILPFDDYRATPDATVDEWAFIYANFFNYFALLYPVMSHVIPWGPSDAPNNPDTVKQFATNMKTFTNPINWDTTIYMPITRDLSAGKRALLYRWCALQGA